MNLPGFLAQVVDDLAFGIKTHDLARHLARVFGGRAADDLFDLRHVGAVHAENVLRPSPKSNNVYRGSPAISPQTETPMPWRFAARMTSRMSDKHGGMSGREQAGDALVRAVDGQCVLNQIIRADRKER